MGKASPEIPVTFSPQVQGDAHRLEFGRRLPDHLRVHHVGHDGVEHVHQMDVESLVGEGLRQLHADGAGAHDDGPGGAVLDQAVDDAHVPARS